MSIAIHLDQLSKFSCEILPLPTRSAPEEFAQAHASSCIARGVNKSVLPLFQGMHQTPQKTRCFTCNLTLSPNNLIQGCKETKQRFLEHPFLLGSTNPCPLLFIWIRLPSFHAKFCHYHQDLHQRNSLRLTPTAASPGVWRNLSVGFSRAAENTPNTSEGKVFYLQLNPISK